MSFWPFNPAFTMVNIGCHSTRRAHMTGSRAAPVAVPV